MLIISTCKKRDAVECKKFKTMLIEGPVLVVR